MNLILKTAHDYKTVFIYKQCKHALIIYVTFFLLFLENMLMFFWGTINLLLSSKLINRYTIKAKMKITKQKKTSFWFVFSFCTTEYFNSITKFKNSPLSQKNPYILKYGVSDHAETFK